jgi:hypothetical protein
MSRILLQYLLPLVLPLAIYTAWTWMVRGRKDAFVQTMVNGPWFWLLVAGLCLMTVGLVLTAVLTGGEPGAVYIPPHLEDGHIVPGRLQ